MGATSRTETTYPSGAPDFTDPLDFSVVCIAQSLVFCVVLCRASFVILSFFFVGPGGSMS
jgi:hypothetical protein